MDEIRAVEDDEESMGSEAEIYESDEELWVLIEDSSIDSEEFGIYSGENMNGSLNERNQGYNVNMIELSSESEANHKPSESSDEPSSEGKHPVIVARCNICDVSLQKRARTEYHVSDGDHYCVKCYKLVKRNRSLDEENHHVELSTGAEFTESGGVECKIVIDINACVSSHRICIFRCPNVHKLCRVPNDLRVQVFHKTGIFVPAGSRCCNSHLTYQNTFELDDLEILTPQTDKCEMTAEDVAFYLNSLRKMRSSSLDGNFYDSISEEKLKQQTGLDRQNFFSLSTHVQSLTIRSERSFALGLYLSKLRHGYTDEHFSVIFDVPRRTIGRYLERVRNLLKENFTQLHLGRSLTREYLIKNQSPMAKLLLDDRSGVLISIWDGTYIYIQRSANYSFQKSSYSMHKHRCLLKPMLAVTTNGLIIYAFGPYPANLSDAKILDEIMETDFFKNLFVEGDVFIVDKGFRDVLEKLENEGFETKMPCFINKNENQLTTETANYSRLVTKIRFSIECINGTLKIQFRYFDHVWQNKSVPHLMDDFRNACALYNAFYSKIESDKKDYELIAELMKQNMNKRNLILDMINDLKLLRKRKMFTKMDAAILPQFPTLSDTDLYHFALGTYQLKQAKSYYAEHVSDTGKYEIQLCVEIESLDFEKYEISVSEPLLLRIQLVSRHSNSVRRTAFLLCDLAKNGTTSIIEYYCQCGAGARTVGCCAHIMAVVWYLGNGRYLPSIREPAKFFNQIFEDGMEVELGDSDSDYEDS